MTAIALPQPAQRPAELAGQPGDLSKVGQQPGAGMPNHTPPVCSDGDLRTGSGSLHLVSAFRDGRSDPSTRQIIPDQKALPRS
jgi:hypothetical protein